MNHHPLGDDASFPARVESVRRYGHEVSDTARRILEQVEELRRVARPESWEAETADAFREQAEDLASRIEGAADRHERVGRVLLDLADDLEERERRAAGHAEDARALQWTVAANPPATPQVPPEGGPPVLTPEGEAQDRRREQALRQIEVLQGRFDREVARCRELAEAAAGTIRSACDDGVKDSWFESVAGFLGGLRDVLGWAAAVVGVVVAVVALVATAPFWLVALGVGLAAAAFVLSLSLALGAEGDPMDVVWDFVGLATAGTGALAARFLSRAFPALRSMVAGWRASNAHRAVVQAVPPDLVTDLRRLASGVVDPAGNALAARQLLRELTTQARAAASAARSATFAPFPVTLTERLVDGGRASSQVARQAREMLLDLRTFPGPVPADLLGDAQVVAAAVRAGTYAANAGAAAEVLQLLTDRPEPGEPPSPGPVRILTDVVTRLT